MREHIASWEKENTQTTWKGPYRIDRIKAEVAPGALVLDAGCGNGKLLMPLTRAGYRAIGIDVSLSALSTIASKDYIVAGDILDLPFKSQVFDAVVCHDVLQHLLSDERQAAVHSLGQSLKPGGILFLEVFGERDMRSGGREIEPRTYARESGIIYHYFTEIEVRALLSGFSVLWIDSVESRKNFMGTEHVRHRISAAGRI